MEEEQPVHVIRESTRNLLKFNRQQRRVEASDTNRSIHEFNISPEIISNIAQKLKTKSCIGVSDLQMLKNGLMNDPNNGSIVLSTHGALRGLVRELTGHEVKKQCASAGCLCNLALADCRACTTIAKASGSYLVTALDNLTTELAVTCAWTLGNLAGSGPKVCEVLISQGAFTGLCSLLQGSGDIQDAAVYALVHFVYQLKDELRTEHLKKILQGLSKVQLTISSAQLLFILSCHRDFLESVTDDIPQKVLGDLPKIIGDHMSICKSNSGGDIFCCKLIYLIRVLGNMDVSKITRLFLASIAENNSRENIFKILSSENCALRDSLLWLLGNLYKFDDDNEFFHSLLHQRL